MAIPVTVIPATFVKVTSFLHNDSENTRIICGIRLGGSEGIGEVYKRVGGVTTLIAQTNSLGKDDSICAVVYPNGDLVVDVSEADVGGAGSTCAIRAYTFPRLLPPSVSIATSSVDSVARAQIVDLKNKLHAV